MTFCAVSSAKEGATDHPSAGCTFFQSPAFSPASSIEQALFHYLLGLKTPRDSTSVVFVVSPKFREAILEAIESYTAV